MLLCGGVGGPTNYLVTPYSQVEVELGWGWGWAMKIIQVQRLKCKTEKFSTHKKTRFKRINNDRSTQ